MHYRLTTGVWAAVLVMCVSVCCAADTTYSWQAPDRAAKVAALIPGRQVVMPTPQAYFAEWTRQQAAKWEKDHKPISPAEAYEAYSKADPADEQLTALIPDHISPFGRLVSGKADKHDVDGVMLVYCPLCGARQGYPYTFARLDPKNPYHGWTYCCGQDLYERGQDMPADYKLRPNGVAKFPHLDGTVKEVPSYTMTDKQGATWEIFPGTILAYQRWMAIGYRAGALMTQFEATGDPLAVHKLAVLLDRVADVYYGLPLSCMNDVSPVARPEWESLQRPVRDGAALGPSSINKPAWNRRSPVTSRGWIQQANECIFVEPFARVRLHPAFKFYSQKNYGDPEALDRKVMTKLMREVAMLYESFAIVPIYQDGPAVDIMMLGTLLGDRYLFDCGAATQECVLYNHHLQDGMDGEGAPNYMRMLDGYYAYMKSPEGWLQWVPDFLTQHPFFAAASSELYKLETVRGAPLEFGDQHARQVERAFLTDPAKVVANEQRPSLNWPGYGVGLLRVGGPGHRQEMMMTYDRVSLHSASDKLGIEAWVDGVPVMREGGYAYAQYHGAYLDKDRPEIQTFLGLPYPREVFEVAPRPGNDFSAWNWGHGHWAHNTVGIDEKGTSAGWEDNEGLGDLITFKGGEAPTEPGAHFQVLDCQDRYAWERVGVKADEFRRTLLAIEGPDGRPYAVDIFRVGGGQRQALYQSGWGDPVDEHLPPVASEEPNLAAYWDKLRGLPPDSLPSRQSFQALRSLKVLAPARQPWDLTWKTDNAAYAPFNADGTRKRLIPEDVGRVRLRLLGLSDSDTTLLRGKGPWVAWINQPLPNGKSVTENVGFRDAWDYLIESRIAGKQPNAPPVKSAYLHILEGFREGEQSAIREVKALLAAPGTALPEGAVAVQLTFLAGHSDTIVFQPRPGEVKLANGLTTDAQYALVRRDARGAVSEVDMVRGTKLTCGKFSAQIPGDLKGTIVDLVGDSTGTRQETALVVRAEAPWPLGDALAGRQISVDINGRYNETFTIEKVSSAANGLLRVALANHAPLTSGWYQVGILDPAKPNVLKSCRIMQNGLNTPLWWGAKAYFPERRQTLTLRKTDSDAQTVNFVDGVDLRAVGIQPGDWFTIYTVEPGLKVSVPGELVWGREAVLSPNGAGAQTGTMRDQLRATGRATISLPSEPGAVW
jgi:hypothetical protein